MPRRIFAGTFSHSAGGAAQGRCHRLRRIFAGTFSRSAGGGIAGRVLVLAFVFDLRPIVLFKRAGLAEVGIVIEVVAFDAQILFGLPLLQFEQIALLLTAAEVLAIFGRDVGSRGAVAVFAGIAGQFRRRLETFETGVVGKEFLRVPTGDVATDALGIELAGRIGLDQGLSGLGVF